MSASTAMLKAGLVGVMTALFSSVALSAETPIPDFSSAIAGWSAQGVNFISPPSGPHQITNDPAHRYVPNGRNEAREFRIADLSNPILQPWAREELRKVNERILSGRPGYTRSVSCWALGVPEFLLSPVQPLYFLQTPKEVVMVQQMDQQVRHVYLNVPHSAGVTPSWYGESVGHYEGDTLVVDTIGLNDGTWIDNYRTPHTAQLHVVERFHLIDGGKVLEVNVHVEDPGAFTTPWDTIQRFDRVEFGPMLEAPCAENNLNVGDLEPMPQANRSDF
ncbi:MAG TPA: hypothetical protein VEU95_17370 [Micropepsaceae bacterium]|nr:hypothetical protein [Micropepsaceae bacterium]